MTENGEKIKIAVFDLDRTIIKGTSAEFILIRYMKERGMISYKNILNMFLFLFKNFRKGVNYAVFRNRAYLKGLKEEDVKKLLPDLWGKCLKQSMSEKIVQQFRELREKGYYIVLISGALYFLLDLFNQYLGADQAIGSVPEINNGVFTGRLTFHPYFWDKVRVFNDVIEGMNVNLKESYMFADSITDVPLLKKCGNPVAVNPGIAMGIYCSIKGWKVIRHL